MRVRTGLNILLFTLLAGVSTAQGQGLGQSKAQVPGKANQPSAVQPPPPLAEAIGPPITFDTHEEYLRAYEMQMREIDPEEHIRLRDKTYISTHPYNLNPFIKNQYCKFRNSRSAIRNYVRNIHIDIRFDLSAGDRFKTRMDKQIDMASRYPYFRKKYFNNKSFYRQISEFTILRKIEHGNHELTGDENSYETIYEVKSHPSEETFLISMSVLWRYFHPGALHPKTIYTSGETTRIYLELEAVTRKKYLDDYGISVFISSMISLYGKWNCDDPVPKK